MKKILIIAALLAAAMTTASAQFGKFTPSETKKVKDAQTGVELKVLTNTEGNDKFIYQTDPMWTPDGKYLLFRSSSRSGEPEVERTMPDGRVVKFAPSFYYFVEVASG